MKYQVIKTGGRYAVRQKWFHFGYLVDLVTPEDRWGPHSRWMVRKDCFTDDEQIARRVAENLTSKIVVIAEYP